MYIVYCTILSCKGSICTLYIVQYFPVKDRDVHCILYNIVLQRIEMHIVYCTILSKQIIYHLFFTFYILHLQICIVNQFLLNCNLFIPFFRIQIKFFQRIVKNPINGFDQINISTISLGNWILASNSYLFIPISLQPISKFGYVI